MEETFLEELERRLAEARERQKTLGADYSRAENEFQSNGTMVRCLEIVIAALKEEAHQS